MRTPVALAATAALLALAQPAAAQDGPQIDRIKVHTPAWDWATQADGEGLYWDLIRAVYEPEGIELDYEIMPYARAVNTVQNGEADAWVAAYLDEAPALYPDYNLDADRVAAAYNPASFGEWNQEDSLPGRRVAWIRGFNYDKYLDVSVEASQVDNRQSGLRQVAAGRVDAFLDAALDLNQAVEESDVKDQLAVGHVRLIKTYMAYAENERGEKLRRIWDERFPQLLEDGTVAELFVEWEWNTWPFDAPSPLDGE